MAHIVRFVHALFTTNKLTITKDRIHAEGGITVIGVIVLIGYIGSRLW
jgi:hypothetical protein